MRVLLLGLVVFAVLGAAAFGISWYFQASEAKKAVEQSIASFNEALRALCYESITTTGFPRAVVVIINNPKFSGNLDKIFPPQPTAAGAAAPAHLEASLAGTIAISINAFSDQYIATSRGEWSMKTTAAEKAINVSTKTNGESTCGLKMERSQGIFDTLWNFKSLARNKDTFLQDFREVDCVFPPSLAYNVETNETAMSSAGGRFYLSSKPNGEQANMRFYVQAKDAEVTQAGDEIYANYIQTLVPQAVTMSKPSLYGKQVIEIDFSYQGPKDWKHPEADNIPLNVQLSKFIVSNALYNSNASLNLTCVAKEAIHNAALKFKAETTIFPTYNVVFHDMAKSMISAVYLDETPSTAALKAKFARFTPEEVYNIVAPAIPDFASLGKFTQAIDATYIGNEQFTNGEATLAAFEFSATPYGITAKGSAKRAEGNPLPSGNITLTCNNCLQLTDDARSYSAKLQKALITLDPKMTDQFEISPGMAEGIKTFLLALALPPGAQPSSLNDKQLTYELTNDTTGAPVVNGKSFMDVMALYNQHILPHSQPKPAPKQ